VTMTFISNYIYLLNKIIIIIQYNVYILKIHIIITHIIIHIEYNTMKCGCYEYSLTFAYYNILYELKKKKKNSKFSNKVSFLIFLIQAGKLS
jgi:hypothetical protein